MLLQLYFVKKWVELNCEVIVKSSLETALEALEYHPMQRMLILLSFEILNAFGVLDGLQLLRDIVPDVLKHPIAIFKFDSEEPETVSYPFSHRLVLTRLYAGCLVSFRGLRCQRDSRRTIYISQAAGKQCVWWCFHLDGCCRAFEANSSSV
jgi:hypothetical protein